MIGLMITFFAGFVCFLMDLFINEPHLSKKRMSIIGGAFLLGAIFLIMDITFAYLKGDIFDPHIGRYSLSIYTGFFWSIFSMIYLAYLRMKTTRENRKS